MTDISQYQSETMSIWDFLENEKPWWADNLASTLCVMFRVVGETGIHKYVSVGKRPPMNFDCYMDVAPGRYAILDGVGGLMGELMDLSVQFNLYRVFITRSFDFIEYTVWLHRLEDGQERNIDADMVERFSKKVCSE